VEVLLYPLLTDTRKSIVLRRFPGFALSSFW